MRRGEYSILQFAAPGAPERAIGVLLLDPETGRLRVRLREDWTGFPKRERAVLRALEAHLEANAAELGGPELVAWMEGTLSNALR